MVSGRGASHARDPHVEVLLQDKLHQILGMLSFLLEGTPNPGFFIFEKTQRPKKLNDFFRPKLNEPVAIVVA